MDVIPQKLLLVLVVSLLLYLLKSRIFLFLKSSFSRNYFSLKDLERYELYLKDFTYYHSLSVSGKRKFITRMVDFMVSKDFQGMHDLSVSEEMKVLISASATQLLFGLKNHILSHYETIRIFPEEFYSKLMNLYMKGGASVNGTILLSWKDFLEGYEKPVDRYNLGLHELAHALKVDVLHGDDFDSRFKDYLNDWEEIGKKEFSRMHNGKTSFLRAYGGSNMQEFFAVCVEHFFEVPLEFKKNLPDIYYHLCILLNQDPSNIEKDYVLEGI